MKKLSLLFAALLTATVMNLRAEEITSWTIAGTETLMGSSWNYSDANNEMKLVEGSYKLWKHNVYLVESDYDYIAVANHTYGPQNVPAPDNVNTLSITAEKYNDGDYDITFTLDAAGTTLSAEYALATDETVNVTLNVNDPSMGSVSGGGTPYKGSIVTATATPNPGYKFVNWTGGKTSTDNPFLWMGTSNITLTANFESETPAGPDMHDFLHFVGLNGNDTVRLNKFANKDLDKLTATFEYSKDRINWKAYDTWATSASPANTYQGNPIALAKGDTVFFRAKGTNGKNATMTIGSTTRFTFAFGADDQIAAGGNIMSLYDATCEQDTMTRCGFYYLFRDAKQLVSAPKLQATKLASYCYNSMFTSCSSLTVAPELSAMALDTNCCGTMFKECSALTTAPKLLATTLAYQCYGYMFKQCTSLTKAPELKATVLAERCYYYMFQGCTSLQVDTISGSCDGAELVVPTVSGTAPANWNQNMFKGCKGDAALTAQYGIQLGGHYCMKEYKEPVCQIGTKGYASIAEAVAEVKAGDTIQVIKDIQLDAVINVTSSTPACTLDLNGHILDGSKLDNQSLLYNASTLYIIDSNPTATHAAPFDTIAGAIMTGGKGWKSGNYSYGGAIYNYNYGTLYMNGVAFVNNTADYGGCVYSYQAASTFKNCRFYGNKDTQYGAALYINSNTCSIDSCVFQENASYCGIIYSNNQATVNVNGSTFVKDSASLGGAAYFYKATSTFKNCRFNGNKGTQYGGAIFVYGNTCSIDSCVFQENASDCGIIYSNNQAIVNVNGSEFINNTAPYGGAAYFYQATSVFKNCSFKENTAEDDGNDNGSGIVYWYKAQGSMDSCVVEDNNAKYGILYAAQASSLTIAHTTITGNSVIDYPGAVGLFTGSSLTMNDGTVITNNTSGADYQSAGVYIWTESGYKNSISMSGKVMIKDNTTNGQPANLCLSGKTACDTVALNSLSEGSEIHVCTMINDAVAPATFAANATEADLQYLKSDNGYAFVLKEGMIASKQAYGRKVTSGKFGTICLDKQFIAIEGIEGLYKPATQTATTLYCVAVELKDVVAGGAYIFKSNADSVTFALEGEDAAAVEANNMKGWLANDYTLVDADVQTGGQFDGYYFFGTPQDESEQKVCKAIAGCVIKKNCAAINLKTVPGGTPAPGRKFVTFGKNVPTGLVEMQNAECTMQSGKMMVNGQLIIIRDGKKFNAQGQEL